jgi:hypothetical protein
MTDAGAAFNAFYPGKHPDTSLPPDEVVVMIHCRFEGSILAHPRPDQVTAVLDESLRYTPALKTALHITQAPPDHARKLAGAVLMLFLKHLLSKVVSAEYVATLPGKTPHKLQALGRVIEAKIPSPRRKGLVKYWRKNKDTLAGMFPIMIFILMKTHIFPTNPIECSPEAAALINETSLSLLITNQTRHGILYEAKGVIQVKRQLPSKFSTMLYMSYMSN